MVDHFVVPPYPYPPFLIGTACALSGSRKYLFDDGEPSWGTVIAALDRSGSGLHAPGAFASMFTTDYNTAGARRLAYDAMERVTQPSR